MAEFDKISVCFYPDLQRFFARLRLNLKRNFNYNEKFSAYCCSVWQPFTPFAFPRCTCTLEKADAALFRLAINKSWPFSNLLMFPEHLRKPIEQVLMLHRTLIAVLTFLSFLRISSHRNIPIPKGFGCYNKLFSLDSIRRKFERGTLTYFAEKTIDGVPAFL